MLRLALPSTSCAWALVSLGLPVWALIPLGNRSPLSVHAGETNSSELQGQREHHTLQSEMPRMNKEEEECFFPMEGD